MTDDDQELQDLRKQHEDRIEKLGDLKGLEIPPLTTTCLECGGRKLMSYSLFRPAPWWMRFFGVIMLRKDLTGVPCRRCDGTGTENLSTGSGVD